MGQLEARVRQRGRHAFLKQAILQTIAIGGILTVAAMAPNVLRLIPKKVLRRTHGTYPQNAIRTAVSKLKKQGLLRTEVAGNRRFLRITKKGEAYMRTVLSVPRVSIPRRWDRKWRVIIFDIHEYKRGVRDAMRRMLTSVGFLKLQHSVWVYPYPCEELIALLKSDLRVGKEVLYLVVEEIENDAWIKRAFGLER